jgi:hypothetical protein
MQIAKNQSKCPLTPGQFQIGLPEVAPTKDVIEGINLALSSSKEPDRTTVTREKGSSLNVRISKYDVVELRDGGIPTTILRYLRQGMSIDCVYVDYVTNETVYRLVDTESSSFKRTFTSIMTNIAAREFDRNNPDMICVCLDENCQAGPFIMRNSR